MSEPRVVQPGEGEAYVMLASELFTVKTRGDRGEGCSIYEHATQAGYQGPPLLSHHHQDEELYVLEGHYEFHVDDRTLEGGPGMLAHFPKGSVHTFRNTAEVDGKVLITFSPAGDAEAFVEEVGEPTQEKSPPTPPSEPPDAATVERLTAVASKHGIDIVAPPSEQQQ
jgi:mannose-6-phosphate isomerase-like protein (cupin superfamily)